MAGVSNMETKPWIAKKVLDIEPKTVMDVGAGAGIYSNLLLGIYGPENIHLTAVEVWKPYVDGYNLRNRYHKVLEEDVRSLTDFKYDLVILGDVLEHMSEDDAISLWDKVSKQARYAIIAIPIIHHPQGMVADNPYEVHVEEDWSVDKVLEKFPGIIDHSVYKVTGAFLAKFF